MTIDVQQQMLIEQRIANEAKSPLLAYLLLLFVGWFGVHRIYLGRKGSGLAMLVLSLVGLLTIIIGVGVVPLVVVGLWCLVDIFLIPGIVDEGRKQLRRELTAALPQGGTIRAG